LKPAGPGVALPASAIAGESSGLGRPAWWFIASLLAAQVGIEVLFGALPLLVQKMFGDFGAVAHLAVVSSFASIFGRQISPIVIERFGEKKAYVGSYLARLGLIAAMIGLLYSGSITLPIMIGLHSANLFIGGVTGTAYNSIPPLLVGQKSDKLERFWSISQTLTEIVAVATPILSGILISRLGFMPALLSIPFAILASMLMVWKKVRMPVRAGARSANVPSGAKPGWLAKLFRGAHVVWENPVLRTSFIAYSLVLMLNPFLYGMLGPGYALRVVGEANAELAASVGGWLTGFYSLGGMLGGAVMAMEGASLAKAREEGLLSEGQVEGALRKSLLRWVVLGTASMALLATMAVPMGTLGSLVPLPEFLAWAGGLTLPAIALIPFGVAQVVAMLKLQSFFQARVPRPEDMADAMGFFGSASLAIATAGLLGLKVLFESFSGLTPFLYFSAMLVPVAAVLLALNRTLARQTRRAP
jgi:MFS family permease